MSRVLHKKNGYTLIELLIATAILSMVVVVIGSSFVNALKLIGNAKSRLVGVSVANEQLERIRNRPYDNIGTTTGWPTGTIPATQTIERSGTRFTVTTRVDYIDDPFDNLVCGSPAVPPCDTVPQDYKRVEVAVTWPHIVKGVVMTARYAPNGLETATDTGSLLITVFDSSGKPVPLADIHVTNTAVSPAVDITNTTDINGNLQLLSLPPSVEGYHVVVSKSGYSTDSTFPVSVGNPEPEKIDSTVAIQEATEISFAIDWLSTLNLSVLSQSCSAIGDIPFQFVGAKLVGKPNLAKYAESFQTAADGTLTINDLEWDDYDVTLNDPAVSTYNIAGFSPPNALNILPDTTVDWLLILAPKTTNAFLATVIDSSTKLPITGAQVHVTATGYDTTLETGRGFLSQTDWWLGPGQDQYGDLTQYESDDGNIDFISTAGQVTLASSIVASSFSEEFTSITQEDTGVTTADWNMGSGLLQLPQSLGDYVGPATGQSVKLNSESRLITTATLTSSDVSNGGTITYYLAADGVSFEQVTPGIEHTFVTPGTDLRFKIELNTSDPTITPQVFSVFIESNMKAYVSSGMLTSSTFDTNSESTYSVINWGPVSQITEVGEDSVRFQIATNNDNATWNYVGPDGTAGTYYTTSGSQISSTHENTRYIRYRLYLTTPDTAHSPVVTSVSIGYTSQCTPPGQVYFDNLSATEYTIEITHPNYWTYTETVNIDGYVSSVLKMSPL
ncbi:MAG: carboxypeptidase regulatory-like domain-containing protein [Patescibacteria group bacterium]|jgi:prepilin-type N-terminal cleavage/methylation domain-containing protein